MYFGGPWLTRAEREALARFRERRAQGEVPGSLAYRAPATRTDPLVTFYGSGKNVKKSSYVDDVLAKRRKREWQKKQRMRNAKAAASPDGDKGCGWKEIINTVKRSPVWEAMFPREQRRDSSSSLASSTRRRKNTPAKSNENNEQNAFHVFKEKVVDLWEKLMKWNEEHGLGGEKEEQDKGKSGQDDTREVKNENRRSDDFYFQHLMQQPQPNR